LKAALELMGGGGSKATDAKKGQGTAKKVGKKVSKKASKKASKKKTKKISKKKAS